MAEGYVLTRETIKSMFDSSIYNRGKRYYEEGRVNHLRLRNDTNPPQWFAQVTGAQPYSVSAVIQYGKVYAGCNCPAFSTYGTCKHVVAVLIAISEAMKYRDGLEDETAERVAHAEVSASAVAPDVTDDVALAQIIQLFQSTANFEHSPSRSHSSERAELQVEWLLQPSFAFQSSTIGIAMKVGPKQTYIVKKIRDFIQAVAEHQPYFFTPKFSYNPRLHSFSENDAEIIRMLYQLVCDEAVYREAFGYYTRGSSVERDKSLWIAPKSWDMLYPLLGETNTVLTQGRLGDKLEISQSPPMLANMASDKSGNYSLHIAGMDDLKLFPSYGCAFRGNTLFPLSPAMIEQISALQRVVSQQKRAGISIPAAALETVVNEVLPKLRRVANLSVDTKISKRIVEVPLVARLYLDWWTDQVDHDSTEASPALAARLEFVYDDVVIDALLDARQQDAEHMDHPTANMIVIRDVEKEGHILDLLQASPFTQQQGHLLLFNEADIYEFLFELLPEIQKMAEVYTTDAIDSRTKATPTVRSRLNLNETTNWLEISFDMAGIDEKEIRDVLMAIVEKKKYHRLADGRYLSLQQGAYAELGDLVEQLGLSQQDLRSSKKAAGGAVADGDGTGQMTMRLPSLRALPLMDGAVGLGVKLGRTLRQWLDNLRHPDNLDAPIPTSLTATLREYQVFGFQWMKTLATYGLGGILADDMGLGKTIQSIAFLLSEKEERDKLAGAGADEGRPATVHSSSLIICPASLTYNWLHELNQFAPSLRAVIVAGNKAERDEILAHAGDYDVLVTSYPLLRRDVEAFAAYPFRTLILDEAQAIKNHGTQTAQASQAIQSDLRFALTGTPIENSLDDLWAILRTLSPDLFGSHQKFSTLSASVIAKRVRPFILRRLKQDVLTELPDKIETLQTSELTDEQKKLYAAYLERLQKDTVENLATEGFQKGRLRILAGLTRLRQICCHPSLCVEGYAGQSGKLEQLLELVDEYMAANQRMLIFSQFTSMLHVIREALGKKGIDYFYLDGDTPVKDRLQMCQTFNEGTTPVFLISLKAGGTGLNLTGADTVILYDLWWNPAVEQQAADRAHRMGQKRTVQVVRMVAKGTIEEKMFALQQRKRDLIDAVVQTGSEGFGALSEEDIRELLMI